MCAFNAGMPKPRLPYVRREKTRHGKYVWYFRRSDGPRIRLTGDYGSPEFLDGYNKALTSEPPRQAPAVSGTFSWLVQRYRASAHYSEAAPSTRRMRDNVLKSVERKIGPYQFASIKRHNIIQAMEDRAETPHAANNFLKIMSGLFRWAAYNDMIAVNPCEGVRKMKAQTDGFHTWTVEEVQTYQRSHPVGTMPRLALDLMLYTGLRRSDAIRAGRQHIKGGILTIRNQKNKVIVSVTIYQELQASIDATKGAALAFLCTERGEPFASPASFGNWFRAQCIAANLPNECRAHGLRKAGATIAAENGATTQELMAMYGWKTAGMAEVYTKAMDRQTLAARAGERIANRMSAAPEPYPAAPLNFSNKNSKIKK